MLDLLKTAIYEVSKPPVLKYIFVITYRSSLYIGLRRYSSDIKALSTIDIIINRVLIKGIFRSYSRVSFSPIGRGNIELIKIFPYIYISNNFSIKNNIGGLINAV